MLRKHFDLVVVALVVVALAFFDLILELLSEVVDLFFELLFEAFEWFELGIEHLIEHVFHTEHHTSQIVTFYLLLLLGGLLIRWLWRALPALYNRCKAAGLEMWVRKKTEFELYWLMLTLPYKLLLLATAIGVAYLASFFVM